LIKLQVLCQKGDQQFNNETPDETATLIERIEMGEVECIDKGKYFIYDKNTRTIVGKNEIQDGQCLVMMPIIKGG
jgi:hypothetical protein